MTSREVGLWHFENELVNFLLPVIKPKFAFFQMEIVGMLV